MYHQHTNECGSAIQKTMDDYGISGSFTHILNEVISRLKNKGSLQNIRLPNLRELKARIFAIRNEEISGKMFGP
jgi:hypothetical protein